MKYCMHQMLEKSAKDQKVVVTFRPPSKNLQVYVKNKNKKKNPTAKNLFMYMITISNLPRSKIISLAKIFSWGMLTSWAMGLMIGRNPPDTKNTSLFLDCNNDTSSLSRQNKANIIT